MSTRPAPSVVGKGAPDLDLSPEELRSIVEQALLTVGPGARVLAVVPDKTRDDNTDTLFPFAAEILAARGAAQFDALVAQGTHMPMTEEEKRAKVGLAAGSPLPLLGHIFDHQWNRPEELVDLGELSARRVHELTGGLISEAVRVNLNRMLAPGVYDTVLIFGATVPHEVAGFAGGAKYFFPGVAGPDLTHATHWLGALASIERVIGRVETPTRHMIEAAADLVPARVISINSVVTRTEDERLRTHALFCGGRNNLSANAATQDHHAAHLAHVSYAGSRDEAGRVIPRYKITMASALDEATCRRVKLGFMDHREFRREDYDTDADTLVVERAGRDLYLVEPH
ncbi:MAG: lactate racemase domain-containing protein [Acidobacteria bacterium]|nr:lactate racemase domain-containing protein [Acidobacteriota bacterium]